MAVLGDFVFVDSSRTVFKVMQQLVAAPLTWQLTSLGGESRSIVARDVDLFVAGPAAPPTGWTANTSAALYQSNASIWGLGAVIQLGPQIKAAIPFGFWDFGLPDPFAWLEFGSGLPSVWASMDEISRIV